MAYNDVEKAWFDYLAHHNQGRGVVLIGHSQGTMQLTALIRRQIDDRPEVRRLLVSALLIGGGVTVAAGKDVGGSFQQVPACRAPDQTGCVVAYSAFRATAPPTASTGFGRSGDSTLVAACTNPAAPAGGETALDGYFDATGSTALPMGPSEPWTVGGRPIETPMVRVIGLLKGRCTSNAFASYLEVTVQRGPGSPASRS